MAIEDFQSTIRVRPDGDLEVLESISVAFTGTWNGIYRMIPVEYRTPQGFSKRLYLDVVSVSDGAGEPLRYEQSRERHYRRIQVWVPGATDALRTVNLRYRVPNALLHFEEHDELYWNVTGDEWTVPIRRASAFVHLPEGATGLRATAYTGSYGSTETEARVLETEDGFYFSTVGGLGFREGLTVVVGWDPGVVERPGALERAALFFRANWLFLLPILVTGFMWRLWHRHGRDPARRAVAPLYEPPEGMTPSEVGTLVDNHPHMRDITAAIVNLAVEGHLRIEEEEESGLAGFFGAKDYVFVRLRGPEEAFELPEHERLILEGIFGRGSHDRVELSDLADDFYKELPPIKDAIYGRLEGAGYYRERPDRVWKRWVGITVATLGLAMIGCLFLASHFVLSPLTAVLAAVFSGVPVLVFGVLMPARTVRGTRKLESILGFQEFLDKVESDRFKRMIDSPEMFERYLPYAMALGLERKWAKAFEGIVTEPPDWYVGSGHVGHFHPTSFVGDMGTLSSQTGAVMASSPRSSGGSGFSGGGGGGFSGGGMGGGGGGGF